MYIQIGSIIHQLRSEKGLTQQQLAEALGVSVASVSKWECENSFPDIALLPEIASVFDVSVDYLLGCDRTNVENIENVISKAQTLSKQEHGDEAVALLAGTLMRYPGNEKLIMSLAEHRLTLAFRKKKPERMELLEKAKAGLLWLADRTTDEKVRLWSYAQLVTVGFASNDLTLAKKYNALLLGVKGIRPRVNEAIIAVREQPTAGAIQVIREFMTECMEEYFYLHSWLISLIDKTGDDRAFLTAALSAETICSALPQETISYKNSINPGYENIAHGYAKSGQYDKAMAYLEKELEFVVKEDARLKDDPSYIGLSACTSLRIALASSERPAYEPLRKTERFRALMERLK